MQEESSNQRKGIDLGIQLMVAAAATALAAMMFLMAADVVGRYFFNSPIPGGLEMVEYFMAIIVPLAIAYCAIERSHVTVDLVTDKLPPALRTILRFIITLLSICFIGLISWQNFAYILETYQSNLTSAVLEIPAFPFVAATAIGMAVYALVMASRLFSKNNKDTR